MRGVTWCFFVRERVCSKRVGIFADCERCFFDGIVVRGGRVGFGLYFGIKR